MGGSTYSRGTYDANATHRAKTGKSAFAHTAAINSGSISAGIHAQMDPRKFKLREARDSDAHPESMPVIIAFDETGSMGEIPVLLQQKLSTLMACLVKQGIDHPQICFSAIGDARNHEAAPCQTGQFESGNEMEDDLSRIYLERNGGGQRRESYELFAYWAARHTVTDSWEKRGKKGYIFFIADEMPFDTVSREDVKTYIGDSLERDIPTTQIFAELSEKWNVFMLFPRSAGYASTPEHMECWKNLLGERALWLEDNNAVSETIALVVALTEGVTDFDNGIAVTRHLSDKKAAQATEKSLVLYATHGGDKSPVVQASGSRVL